jgi:hypothetical protein
MSVDEKEIQPFIHHQTWSNYGKNLKIPGCKKPSI